MGARKHYSGTLPCSEFLLRENTPLRECFWGVVEKEFFFLNNKLNALLFIILVGVTIAKKSRVREASRADGLIAKVMKEMNFAVIYLVSLG